MRHELGEHTVRMIRVPPAQDHLDTQRIPIIPMEEDRVYDDITEREPLKLDKPEVDYERRPRLTADEIKERQLTMMTMSIAWFILLAIFVIVGSFVWKLSAIIIG